jgi:hypothetical protein
MKAAEVAIPTQSSSTPTTEDELFWKRHVELHQSSGLTRTKYCRLNKVNYDRFGYWLGKFARQSSSLVAVKLKTEDVSTRQATLCTLNLGNGRVLQIHDQQTLFAILEKWS